MEEKPPPQNTQLEESVTSQPAQMGTEDDATGVMKRAVSEFVSARMELAAIEAKEAVEFTVRKVVSAVVLALCAFFAWALALAGLAGLLADWAEQHLTDQLPGISGWVIVLFGLAIIHAIVAIIFVLLLKKKPSAPLFELTRQEIENDKVWVKSNK